MKTITTTLIDYNEFNQLVRKTWPQRHDFECVPEFEWGNDQDHTFEVFSEDYNQNDLNDWLLKKKHTCIGEYQLLSAFVTAGVLQPGTYTIQVSW